MSRIRKKSKWPKRIKLALLTLIVGGAVSVGSIVLLFLYVRTQPLPAAATSLSTQILDMNGTVIDSFYDGKDSQPVSITEIAPDLVNATIAIEDRRFYSHTGFDWRGMARAAYVDLRHMSKVQGASTLSQQLARNLFLTNDRTWKRKLKEAFYTAQLEMHLSKEEIVTQYLNTIYYGHGAYGIKAAAKLYYNKLPSELSLAESAMLAGVPKGPTYYSPYFDMTKAKNRQLTILREMVAGGYISELDEAKAVSEPLQLQPLTGRQMAVAPYFRDYVKDYAVKTLGISELMLNSGGIRIYTTLDVKAQHAAEQAVAHQIEAGSELQAALIAIDPRTGHIKAMVGGTDYGKNQFNRVFADTRQPGSSFKPIVYLTALASPTSGITPVTRFMSEPTAFAYDEGRQTYTPSNFGNHYLHEEIDLRQALAQSDNIYAVQTIMQVGAEQVIDTARKLGIHSDMKPLPSLALGTFPVSPIEMASAMGTIGNGGIRLEPTAITRIEDSKGRILYEAHAARVQAVDPASSYVMTSVMESVFEAGGTANRVSDVLKRPVAGKTGTTDSDAWMVGFTPELATAVWVGYDRGKTIGTIESRKAAPIFAEFTEQALASVPPKAFTVPDGIVQVYIDSESGKLAGPDCPSTRLESFISGTEPTETCSAGGIELPEPLENERDKSWWSDLKRWWND